MRADQVDEEALYRKVILRIVPLFFLGFVLSYLDRVNISLAKLSMAQDFGLSEHAFAIGASIFFWGYMLFEIPSNLLLQRVGARVWLARIMITWGLVSTLMIFSQHRPVFYGLRLLLGICEAGFVPGVFFYANEWLPSARQSRMFAFFLLALPTAEVIGAPVSGLILRGMADVGGLRAWQWLFLLEGLPTVVLGVGMYVLLRNRPAEVDWLSAEEKRVLESQLREDEPAKAHRFVDALRSARVYLLIGIMILFNTSFYGLVFWVPTLLRNAGVVSETRIGNLVAIPFAVGGVVMVMTSMVAERTGRQRSVGVGSALVAAGGMFATTLPGDHLAWTLVALSVAVSGVLSIMPIFWALPGRLLAGSAAAGGLALINSCGSLSGLLGVLVIGYAGFHVGMMVFATMLLMSGALLYMACSGDGVPQQHVLVVD